jgi:hypothetical protein
MRNHPKLSLGRILLAGVPLLASLGLLPALTTSPSASAATASPLNFAAAVPIDKPNQIISLSCPSVSMCVATDAADQVVTSPQGGSGTWQPVKITNNGTGVPLGKISCASASLCAITDATGVLVSTNPWAVASTTWRQFTLPGSVHNEISCPSLSFCATVAPGGS